MQYLSIVIVLLGFCFISYANSEGSSQSAESKERLDKINKHTLRKGEQHLQRTQQIPGVIKLKSGTLIEVLDFTTNHRAQCPRADTDVFTVYKALSHTGELYDERSTHFPPSEVHKGLTEVMLLMCVGDKYRAHIPHYLAFGANGSLPTAQWYKKPVPPYAVVIYEIEYSEVYGSGKSLRNTRRLLEKSTESITPPAPDSEDAPNNDEL